jgi:membrane-bound serine protease (ClpP class)
MRWPACIKLASAALLLAVAGLVKAGLGQEAAGRGREAVLLEVTGAIGPATTEYLRQGFKVAADRDAALIVLRMDPPGGLDSAMRDIVRDILASPIPIVTYVSPSGARAASAGTYILYASHLAAMAPGTNLGAATPVQFSGGGERPRGRDGDANDKSGGKTPTDALTSKAVNDAAAYIRGLADLHGRNAQWAEAAVREAASLPASEAREKGIIEILASDLNDVLAQAHGRLVRVRQNRTTLDTAGLAIVPVEPNWRIRLLAVITNPNIAFILMLVGVYGILFELVHPGTIFSGVLGGISLLVALFALNLLPVNYAGVGLVGLGIALMVAEAFTPSLGVLGIGGAVSFAVGAIFLFDTDVPGFTLSPGVILAATASGSALALLAGSVAVRSRKRPVVTGDATLVGRSGRVLTWSGGEGQVQVHGERWQARAANPCAPGQRVRVVGREGLTLVVEAAADPPAQERGPL